MRNYTLQKSKKKKKQTQAAETTTAQTKENQPARTYTHIHTQVRDSRVL